VFLLLLSSLLQFNQHVIIETNKTTERIFPAVPDVEHPDFFKKMDYLVELNGKVRKGGDRGLSEKSKSLV
jgi:magnesium-protoporphyrin IX monomethyl ester (oxidative) cyclase